MTQTTVARKIATLEHALRLTLFEKDTRGFHITADGVSLLPAAEAMEAAARSFESVAAAASRHEGPIRVTAPNAMFDANFARIFAEFSRANPGVWFEFLPGEKVLDLAAGEADVAFRGARVIEGDTLICRKIYDVEFSVVASEAYAAAHGVPSTVSEIRNHDVVCFAPGNGPREVAEWLRKASDKSRIVNICTELQSMTAAILSDFGVGVMTERTLRRSRGVVRCMRTPPETWTPLWLVVAPEAYRRSEVKQLAAFLVREMRMNWKVARSPEGG